MAQLSNPGTVGNFGEHSLRIEARDEGLGTDIVRDDAGDDANGAIGPEVDARSRHCGQQDRDSRNDPFSQVHMLRPERSAAGA
jgi:hypothetical protein